MILGTYTDSSIPDSNMESTANMYVHYTANTSRFAERNNCEYRKIQVDSVESMEQFRSEFNEITKFMSQRIRPAMLEIFEQTTFTK
jgi:hypothetical protein